MTNLSPFRAGDKVVAYCRYSEGDEQGLKNQSTEEQADAIRAFCDANHLHLIKIFSDPFASGRSIAKRDSYLEMLSFLLHKKKPDVQGLILWDFERYGRNFDQAQLDAARLRMAGYKLYSLQQPIVDESPFARVLESMYFASAQNQSDMISADVKRALQNNFTKYKVIPRSCIGWGWIPEPVNMGVLSDGSPRIGYRAVPDPAKIDVIRKAVDARIAGASRNQCRKMLGLHDNDGVMRLFSRTLLYGSLTYGGTLIENYCDPIITKERFEALRTYENANPRKQIGRQGGWSADPPMLSGLLYCAECGHPMYIYRRKSKGHTYCSYYCEKTCFSGVKQTVLENLVIEAAGEILSEKNVRRWIDYLSRPEPKVNQKMIEAMDKELSDIQRKIGTVTDLLVDRPSEALSLKLSELELKRDALRDRLQTMRNGQSKQVDTTALYNSTLELIDIILRILRSPESSAEIKKTALENFVRSVVVDRSGNIVINFLPPFYSEVVTQSRVNRLAPPVGTEFGLQLRLKLPSKKHRHSR